MNSDEKIEKGSIFNEIVKRFGNPADYQSSPKMNMDGMDMNGKKMDGMKGTDHNSHSNH